MNCDNAIIKLGAGEAPPYLAPLLTSLLKNKKLLFNFSSRKATTFSVLW